MTRQQIRLAIETAETGTVSAAAEKLGISQPNASLSIKKLEEEIGYLIFHREGGHMFPTEEGYRFIEHAQALLDEDRAIRAIGTEENIPRLRVGAMNIACAIDSFLRFCHETSGTRTGDYTCINVSPETGMKLLNERNLDVLVSIQMKETMPLVEKQCRENRFSLIKIAKVPMSVRLRKDHPLVLNGTLDGSAKGFKQLSSYPYADYIHLEHVLSVYNQTATIPFGCSYKIFVDERDTRLRVLQETDAYNVGMRLSADKMENYGLVSIPIGIDATLTVFVRKGDDRLRSIARYLEILSEEAAKLTAVPAPKAESTAQE